MIGRCFGRRFRPAAVLAAVLVVLAAPAAGAGTIAIRAETKCISSPDRLRAEVTVTNTGLDPATDVSLKAWWAEETFSSREAGYLPPDEPLRFDFDFGPPPAMPGVYPLLVEVLFHDIHGQPFSTLSHGLFVHGVNRRSQIELDLRTRPAAPQGLAAVKATNAGAQPSTVSIRFFAVRELRLERAAAVVELSPGESEIVAAGIENRSVSAASSYPVLVAAEYEVDGVHYTTLASEILEVRPPQDFFKRMTPLLLILAGMLAVLSAVLEFRGRRGPAGGS